ncbi:hypothetical protein LINGRAHAP2_LOCUS11282 [Linum grandiflorum]
MREDQVAATTTVKKLLEESSEMKDEDQTVESYEILGGRRGVIDQVHEKNAYSHEFP